MSSTGLTREQAVERPTSEKPYKKLVRSLATVTYKRAHQQGFKHISFEDVLQETWMIWCNCRNKFDPTRDIQFDTYFSNAMFYSYGQVVRNLTDMPIVKGIYSKGNSKFSNSNSSDQTEKEKPNAGILEQITDNCVLQDEVLSRKEQTDLEYIASTKPFLAALLRIVIEPSEELDKELVALKAKYEYGKAQGFDVAQPAEKISLKMLVKTFNFDWRHRERLSKEIEDVNKNV